MYHKHYETLAVSYMASDSLYVCGWCSCYVSDKYTCGIHVKKKKIQSTYILCRSVFSYRARDLRAVCAVGHFYLCRGRPVMSSCTYILPICTSIYTYLFILFLSSRQQRGWLNKCVWVCIECVLQLGCDRDRYTYIYIREGKNMTI